MNLKDSDNYINKFVNKRYEDAKFYLDILIESGVIKNSDEKIKQLFIDWFTKNKEFDLQIENGDFAIEEGDFKIVPDIKKEDILEFLNWYDKKKQDFINYLNEKGIPLQKQNSILHQNIKAENIIYNNGQIKSLHQNNQSESKKTRWDIIGLLGLVIGVLTFFFGDNIIEKFTFSSNVLENNNNSEFQTYSDTIQIPYLSAKPILDKGLYIKQNYTELIFGGANINSVRVCSRKETGERIEIKSNNDNALIIDIYEMPYIEFSYKKSFYSLETFSKNSGNCFFCIIKRIKEPTLNLEEIR